MKIGACYSELSQNKEIVRRMVGKGNLRGRNKHHQGFIKAFKTANQNLKLDRVE